MYTDSKTNITFGTWGYTPNATDPDDPGYGAFRFGMVLPPNALTVDANDYIGLLVSL
jgi:cellobiose dehydrogenase (acceptor)